VAISSLLNPGSIARERSTTAEAAQNFITGGSPLGEGVVASAANKIVGFQRGAAAVAARPPDLNSIIQTLSSNILTNVENRVQSINQNVTQVVNQKIAGLEEKYKNRLDKVDSAKPNSILQNFLNLYKEALGYIQFLGNRKNVRTLGENLKALQSVFTETFNVAKIIRQTIVKIVKQLSNLPTASAGGGGLNLDIDIPGGGLRRGPMGMLSKALRVGGKAGLMLGGAALAGGLGSKVVSGILDVGGDVQAAPMTEGAIPGILLDRFNSILDRFSSAISSLSNVKKSQPTSGGGVSTIGAKPKTKEGKTGGAPAAAATSAISSAPGDEKLAAFVASMEAASPENAADAMQVMLNRSASGKYGKGLAGVLSGYDQFSPISAAIFGKSADPAAAAKYGPIAAKLPGNTPQEKFQYLQKVSAEPDGLNKLQQIFGGGSAGVAATIVNDPKYLEASRQNVKGALNFYGGRQGQSGDIQFRSGGNWFYNFGGKIGTLGTQPKPVATTAPSRVSPAPVQQQTQQQIAQTVSQPPVQQAPQVNIAPLNIAAPQAQSAKVGETMAPPPIMSKGGVTVPFLSSSNHDNFLTLYSKMVYNIVDG
jgi:hypothetical protein